MVQAQCATIANCDACSTPNLCDACEAGRWFTWPQGGSPTCQVCTVCQSGEIEISPCQPFSDRECGAACPSGSIHVGGTCEDCGVLDCATCSAPGTCTECAAGFYLSGGSCVPCTVCAPGNHVATACDGTQDTVCAECALGTFASTTNAPSCTECAPGTFAGVTGSTTCMPCAADAIAASSGATECTACSSGLGANVTATACIEPCGDGRLQEFEACDDGNTTSDDGCSECVVDDFYTCDNSTLPSVCEHIPCGNGVREASLGEECDDGNNYDYVEDGCEDDCTVDHSFTCTEDANGRSVCSLNPKGSICSTSVGPAPAPPWFAISTAVTAVLWNRRRRRK